MGMPHTVVLAGQRTHARADKGGGQGHIPHPASQRLPQDAQGFSAQLQGVSTKYLNNYLIWNNTAMHGGGSLTEKLNALPPNPH